MRMAGDHASTILYFYVSKTCTYLQQDVRNSKSTSLMRMARDHASTILFAYVDLRRLYLHSHLY